jgi:Na+/H+ antiporter NhaD/arsenite permease-like protein
MVCLLTVFRLIPAWVCLAAAVVVAAAVNYRVLAKVDYALLATFVCFLVFVGNIARIGAVSSFFSDILAGRELIVGILLSQVISNVPAAVMLSGFTDNGVALLLGVDIGGLGTIIASLASLISFQFYRKSENAKPGKYLLAFTGVSIVLLVPLVIMQLIIM